MKISRSLAAILPAALLILGACGAPDESNGWAASIYPAQYLTARIADEPVTLLTEPGVEPHDLELSARDVIKIQDAKLFVFASGVQPAVDDAVGENSFDIALSDDPHVWLDPKALIEVVPNLTAAMIAADPDSEDKFTANSAALLTELAELDQEYASGLSQCARKEVISTHNAFAQLAQRYGLVNVSLAGNDPHGEPTATQIAKITDLIKSTGATTIFSEPLAPGAITETIADETSVNIETLDPIEGLSPNSDADYFSLMRSNLVALRTGLDCK